MLPLALVAGPIPLPPFRLLFGITGLGLCLWHVFISAPQFVVSGFSQVMDQLLTGFYRRVLGVSVALLNNAVFFGRLEMELGWL